MNNFDKLQSILCPDGEHPWNLHACIKEDKGSKCSPHIAVVRFEELQGKETVVQDVQNVSLFISQV